MDMQFTLCHAQEKNCTETALLVFFDFNICIGSVILN